MCYLTFKVTWEFPNGINSFLWKNISTQSFFFFLMYVFRERDFETYLVLYFSSEILLALIVCPRINVFFFFKDVVTCWFMTALYSLVIQYLSVCPTICGCVCTLVLGFTWDGCIDLMLLVNWPRSWWRRGQSVWLILRVACVRSSSVGSEFYSIGCKIKEKEKKNK